MVLSPQYLKKIFGNTKKSHTFAHVEVTAIINILNILQLCKNLLFPSRRNPLVVMLFRLMLLILLRVLDLILNEFLDWVLLLLWTRLKRRMILLNLMSNLRFKVMKTDNIWKIIIGAISAALGYILSAIGV
nr:MAG TPA: hypothetical protein [Microviridae sp.]